MELPFIGPIDTSPTGLFLGFAILVAIGYFGYQLFGVARAGRKAPDRADQSQDATSEVESGHLPADDSTDAKDADK
jgi:hypothetical protein